MKWVPCTVTGPLRTDREFFRAAGQQESPPNAGAAESHQRTGLDARADHRHGGECCVCAGVGFGMGLNLTRNCIV